MLSNSSNNFLARYSFKESPSKEIYALTNIFKAHPSLNKSVISYSFESHFATVTLHFNNPENLEWHYIQGPLIDSASGIGIKLLTSGSSHIVLHIYGDELPSLQKLYKLNNLLCEEKYISQVDKNEIEALIKQLERHLLNFKKIVHEPSVEITSNLNSLLTPWLSKITDICSSREDIIPFLVYWLDDHGRKQCVDWLKGKYNFDSKKIDHLKHEIDIIKMELDKIFESIRLHCLEKLDCIPSNKLLRQLIIGEIQTALQIKIPNYQNEYTKFYCEASIERLINGMNSGIPRLLNSGFLSGVFRRETKFLSREPIVTRYATGQVISAKSSKHFEYNGYDINAVTGMPCKVTRCLSATDMHMRSFIVDKMPEYIKACRAYQITELPVNEEEMIQFLEQTSSMDKKRKREDEGGDPEVSSNQPKRNKRVS